MSKKEVLKALCIFFITGAFLFMAYGVDAYDYQDEIYKQKVREIIFEHGLRVTEIGSDQKGLAYYEIINLDKSDNQRELYVLYFDKNKSWEVYTEEIWSYNLEKERLERIHSFSHNASGKIDDLTTSFVYSADKTYLMKVSCYTKGDGDHPYENRFFSWHEFFGLQDGKFIKISQTEYLWENSVEHDELVRETFYISDDVVGNFEKLIKFTESEYRDFLIQFGADHYKTIIESESGSFQFGFDITKNKGFKNLTSEFFKFINTILLFFLKQSLL